MSGFLPSFIGGGGASNDLTETRTLFVQHRIREEKADGIKTTFESSIEHTDNVHCEGSDWLNPQGSSWNGKRDKADQHFRTDKKSTIYRTTKTIEDKNGNKKIEEWAGKKEDLFMTHGTMLISDESEVRPDERNGLIENFSTNASLSTMLGTGKGFIPLIE
jgi:hypothetical protein